MTELTTSNLHAIWRMRVAIWCLFVVVLSRYQAGRGGVA